MSLYGGMSKGERMRIKTRVRTAMAAQASIEGRFLGGRPPYGYCLADAGLHPNPAKAATGQHLRRLVVDPEAAPVVQRIFAEFAGGAGLHRIASDLTRAGVPSPSAHDPARNPHRAGSGGACAKTAVRSILANPRHTGHQVWNRQRRDEVLIDVEDVGLGHENKMGWNDRTAWVWSEQPVHEALIPMETFEAVQAMFGRTRTATRRTPAEGRHYLLAGVMRCGLCGRRMQGAWNHGRPYYRCKFADDCGIDPNEHPRSIYIKEDSVVPGLARWLAGLFDNEHLDHTCEVLAGAAEPDPDYESRQAELETKIRDCDRRLARYREALEHVEGEVVPIARWIAEVQRERNNLEVQLGRSVPGGKLTTAQVKALVGALQDIVGVLADAVPAEKADLYRELGVSLTYHPDGRVAVEALPRGVVVRVGEGT